MTGLGIAGLVLPSFSSSGNLINAGAEVTAKKKILPKALLKGDTIAITGPAGAIYEPETIDRITSRLTELGFKTVLGKTLYERFGYLAGTDQTRADELMGYYRDANVKAILTMRGGWGCAVWVMAPSDHSG